MQSICKIWSDPDKNRLYLVFRGSIPDDMAKAAAERVIEETRHLRPGFCVVNDISQAQPASPWGEAEIRRVQAFLGYMGIERLIRILPHLDSGVAAQFGHTGPSYPTAQTAGSIEEADAILDRVQGK
jgi:hypothetical protein